MTTGQKVICVDDRFPSDIAFFYDQLPVKDKVYVIRQVSIGVNWKGEAGEVCLLLIGLVNPKSDTPPNPERGFNSERFRPLEEVKEKASRVEFVTESEAIRELEVAEAAGFNFHP